MSSATGAPPASATPDRCPTRSVPPSATTISWWPRCSPGTATSKAASPPMSAPTSSPPLVVAYAIAGTIDIDLTTEPLGADRGGNPVYLRDIWPTQEEIAAIVAATVTDTEFRQQYADVFEGSEVWKAVEVEGGDLYDWDETSTYIHEPPFFKIGRASCRERV